jgi:hypothetical protein
MFINPKGVGKRIVVDRQKFKTRSETRRYRVGDKLVVKAGRRSGRQVQSPETGKGQNH